MVSIWVWQGALKKHTAIAPRASVKLRVGIGWVGRLAEIAV